MKEKILKEGEHKINPNDSSYIKKAFDFCSDYLEKVDVIRKQTEIIEKAQRVAKDVSKVTESVSNNDFSMYFNEMDDNTTKTNADGTEKENKSSGSGKDTKLAVYFKVSSNVLAAKMTMYQKLFNEYFKFCHWYIKTAGGPAFITGVKSGSSDNKSETAK